MKKILQQILLAAGVSVITGCSTVDTDNVNQTKAAYQANHYAEDKKTNLENLRYLTKATPARIKIQVISDSQHDPVTRAVEGAIANAGYEVVSDTLNSGLNVNPYLTIVLRNVIEELDQLGNYYSYKGKTELSVKRNITTTAARKTLLAREVITAQGARKLGKVAARDSIAEKLGLQSAEYVKKICDREMGGISSVSLVLEKRMIEEMFNSKDGSVEQITAQVLKKMASVDGILAVHKISADKRGVTAQVIYRKKNFPNGVVQEYIDGNFKLKSGNRIDEFVKRVVK